MPDKPFYNGPFWDSHIHIFPEKMMKAIFAFFYQKYQWKLPFSFKPQMLLSNLKTESLEKAFVLAYVHKPGISGQLNNWLYKLSQKHPWLVPFGSVHPGDHDLESVVACCLDKYQFPGMKLHCLVQQCSPDDPRLDRLYQAIVERSGGIIIHASTFPQQATGLLGIKPVTNLLRRFPHLNIIIPHLGLYDLHNYRELIAEYDGLFLDTAFVFQNGSFIPPIDQIMDIMHAFPNRIIYGSDYPFILEPPQNGINRILELELPQNMYSLLFYKNAKLFLNRISSQKK